MDMKQQIDSLTESEARVYIEEALNGLSEKLLKAVIKRLLETIYLTVSCDNCCRGVHSPYSQHRLPCGAKQLCKARWLNDVLKMES